MQEVVVIKYCDYPECAGEFKNFNPDALGQTTTTVDFWFNAIGKGRKTQPIKVELCDTHKDMLRDAFVAMQRYDQKEH